MKNLCAMSFRVKMYKFCVRATLELFFHLPHISTQQVKTTSSHEHRTPADVIRKMISHLYLFAFLTIIRHESFACARLWSEKFDLWDTKFHLKCKKVKNFDKFLQVPQITPIYVIKRARWIFLWMLTSNCHSNWVYICNLHGRHKSREGISGHWEVFTLPLRKWILFK